MPSDLVLFAVVVGGFFVIGLPRIMKNVTIPAELELEEVAPHDLSDRQRAFFSDLDAKLSEIGFRPALTWRATNLQGQNLLRTYLSDSDPACINLTLLRTQVENAEDQSASYLEVITRCADGALVTTRNAEVSEVLDHLPDQHVSDLRGIRDARRLKERHDARLEEFRHKGMIPIRREEIFDRFREHHRRWCEHQVQRGLARYDGGAGVYRLTARTGLRGIRNFLNPLADNFTWPRLIAALALGSVIPSLAVVAVYLPSSPLVEWSSTQTIAPSEHLRLVVLGVAFALAGSVVGALFAAKSFIWSFLLAYLPLRLLGPAGLMPLGISLWTGFVADRVSSWRMRRQRIV